MISKTLPPRAAMAKGQMGSFKACIFIVLLGYCTKQRPVIFKSYQRIKQANIAVVISEQWHTCQFSQVSQTIAFLSSQTGFYLSSFS